MRKPPGKEPGYRDWAKKRVCELMATGMSLRQACREENMPAIQTILNWTAEDPVFAGQYARARELLHHHWAEEILEISDETAKDTLPAGEDGERPNSEWIARSRLRVDSRKWLLSKLVPKVYGDKIETTHGVTDSLADLMRAIDGKTRGLPGTR